MRYKIKAYRDTGEDQWIEEVEIYAERDKEAEAIAFEMFTEWSKWQWESYQLFDSSGLRYIAGCQR